MINPGLEAPSLRDTPHRTRFHRQRVRSIYHIMGVLLLTGCGITDLIDPPRDTGDDPEPVSVATSHLPAAALDVAYEKHLSAEGGDGTYSWSLVDGALPDGLELTEEGVIHGTPVLVGDATFAVRVESGDGQAADRTFTLSVDGHPVSIVTEELPVAVLGEEYVEDLVAEGGDGTWTWYLVEGHLPSGLSLTDGGVVRGTPAEDGDFAFVVKARAGTGQYATRRLVLTVVGNSMVVTTESLPSGTAGVPYEATLEAEGGSGSYSWMIAEGALPAGLSLTDAGVIQGTPTQSGESEFLVRAEADGGHAASRVLSIVISAPPVVINTSSLPMARVGVGYEYGLTATGGDGDFVWSIVEGALPSGLVLSADGVIEGVPDEGGLRSFTVRVESGDDQTVDRELSIEVEEGGLTIYTEANLPAAAEGLPYQLFLDWDGGEAPWTWSMVSGALPNDLFLASWGAIQGFAVDPGTYVFTLRVESGDGQSAERTFTLVVEPNE